MKPEKRNRLMDLELTGKFLYFPDAGHEVFEAIRACDAKARAWDDFEKWVNNFSNNQQLLPINVKEKLRQLLAPPPPKDPLEELEAFVKQLPYCNHVYPNDILAEIRRLKEKK